MDFREAVAYINSFTDYEKLPGAAYAAANFDLRRLELLLERWDNPHLKPATVHLAGTKGKGSTAAMIATVLQTAGYRTGFFTSPHLHTIRERIRVNGELISAADFARLVTQAEPDIEAINSRPIYGILTTFEILTAVAFAYFWERRVDLQVIEAGLGGRLDATNVVSPLVSVITSISYDHTEILGDTLAKIATEKAGIIKPHGIVVSSLQAPEAAQVIERVCREREARLIKVGEEVTWHQLHADLQGQSFTVTTRNCAYHLHIPLLGDYQMENAATAVATLEALMQRGFAISSESIIKGLASIQWPGRLQILEQRPWLIADGAHNAYSAQKAVEAIKQYFPFEKLILLMGTSVDKDITGMARELAPIASVVVATRSRHPRSARPEVIADRFQEQGKEVFITQDTQSGLAKARALASPEDLILATGSLFIVAEVIQETRGVVAEEVK